MSAIPESIPVLDLSTARSADGSFDPGFIDQLRDATHRIGFFQLVGYGAAQTKVEELFDVTKRFFGLPLEDRLALDNRNSPHFRGYTRLGTEITKGRPDAREQVDFGPERAPVAEYPADQPYWLVQGPNQFPDQVLPELRATAMDWAEAMSWVGAELLSAIAVSLELPEDHFTEPFEDTPAWMAKLIHYVGGVVKEAGTQGVGAHADYGFITLLLQDSVGGLEVKPHESDTWLPVEPIRGALVVNLGEMLEVATQGYLSATIHRVLAPAPGVDRYAIPFFWSPRLDSVIDPVTLPAELAGQSRGISDDPDNPMLASYGANVLKGWLRAHPQVAKLHHPELVGK
ncbi:MULTISPECIES: 2-oxoglutarate and iron-dependent oxygenase domain-containing protein [unclassified Arthrobacter]|uniref:isopenicillin N synthase family dioxygenase n=1 Tax=unclassified Arthrobacter TaxID=235627 RepID=UPI001E56AFE0|nr:MULTISPECIES: 2-oxoglutarate and iron-dependent oxygenase domain-containing protein [unclassified Arthrobacter]MCC9146779.1 isopenicillin N synthase family oxygenase [Arthrobacter sp. zg-Y919]MDK1278010.1 2-oxoglutarate and iron-dependent oxygenase domain-containing protein [Arthrobacter sp. zg.Y919]WIB03400.1 2-oxoglutarate and iron-dependent oxygenase domain-containing protein [Arthrobacter sp. zg-Y919]